MSKKALAFILLFLFFFLPILSMAEVIEKYQEIVSKNIFSPERRYEPMAKGDESPTLDRIKRRLHLHGVFTVKGKRYALVKVDKSLQNELKVSTSSTGYVRLKEGDSLGPYTVSSITSGELTLKDPQGRIFTINMEYSIGKVNIPKPPTTSAQKPKTSPKLPFKHKSNPFLPKRLLQKRSKI